MGLIMKAIGPTFSSELAAAGLRGLPFAWGADGSIQFDPAITDAEKILIMNVYTAHDPLATPAEAPAVHDVNGGAE